MATTERVTVRMSRGDSSTPWGFRIQGGTEYGARLTIGRVIDGSLADRAGLRDGDKVLEIGRSQALNLSHQGAQDAIVRSGNTLGLVVERFASRTWKPFVAPIEFPAGTESVTASTVTRPFGQPQQNYSSRSVVTEHYSNAKPAPADRYLQQTGGPYGTDARLTAPGPRDDPTYLKSETLRLVRESDSRSSGGPRSQQPALRGAPPPPASIGGAPACDHCGRVIHGVFCKAGGRTLHGDCFKCATCGGPLKNVGFFLFNGKLFCDIHARQQQENQFKAAPPVDPDLFHTYPIQGSRKPVEPPKSFYQPSVLQKGPVSVQVPAPSSLSPRGAGDLSNFSSNYQYRTTTKTTTSTTNQQQQQQQQQVLYPVTYSGGPPPSWEQPRALPPSQPLTSPPLRSQPQYYSSSPSPRSTSYNVQSDRTDAPYQEKPDLEAPPPNPDAQSKASVESETTRPRRREKWPPPPDPDRQVIPYWRIPVGLSSDFGPGAYLSENEDYRRVVAYRPSSEKPPPKPKRNFLLEDVHKLEEWKLEQERLAPQRAATAAMLKWSSADVPREEENQEQFLEKPKMGDWPVAAKFVELWQEEEKRPNGRNQENESAFWPFADQKSNVDGSNAPTYQSHAKTDPWSTRDHHPNGINEPSASAYDQQSTRFSDTFETRRNEKSDSRRGPNGEAYQSPPFEAFAIETRTEYQLAGCEQKDDPLEELTRDLLSLCGESVESEAVTATRMSSDSRSVSTTKWGGGGGGAPSFGPGRQPAAGARIPRRGRGILKQLHEAPRIPVCESCNREIRGPFVLALNKTWCPDHFICATSSCRRKLLDIGFVEEHGLTYCEFCYEKYLAPTCSKCSRSVVGDCLTALGRQWHPECFLCSHCRRPIGNNAFYMENGQPYCENDWSQLFTTKCVSCQFAIDPGDRWVEALGNAYHSDCFSCSVCQKNLEGQSFFAKGGRPYCKAHA